MALGKIDKSPDISDVKRPYWLDKACPDWCDNLHEESNAVSDRRHISEWLYELVLSTEEPEIYDGLNCFPREIKVYIDQHVREAEPRIVIAEALIDVNQLSFTPTEARQFGEALIYGATLATKGIENSHP